jgi:hypothetical protein
MKKAAEGFEHVERDPMSGAIHGSQLGKRAEHVAEETFKPEEDIDKGRVEAKKLKSFKLDELTKDYYLFTLAPIYYMVPVKVDFIYQFGRDLMLDKVEDVVTYTAPSPMFMGLGDWGYVLQGVSIKHKSLFKTWAKQLVFTDQSKVPNQYWRINVDSVPMLTPGHISTAAQIDIYTPSGVDFSFQPVRKPNGVYSFRKLPPEKWVTDEAYRFFIKTGGK